MYLSAKALAVLIASCCCVRPSHSANIAATARTDEPSLRHFHDYLKQRHRSETVEKIRQAIGIDDVPREVVERARRQYRDNPFGFDRMQADQPERARRSTDDKKFLVNNRTDGAEGRIYFDVSRARPAGPVGSVHVHYRLRQPPADYKKGDTFKYELHVYRYTDKEHIDDSPVHSSIRMVTASAGAPIGDKVDIKRLVDDWMARPHENYGLMLTARPLWPDGSGEGDAGRVLDLLMRESTDGADGRLYLEFDTAAAGGGKFASMRRDTLANDTCRPEAHQCCRHKYSVVFSAMNNMSHIQFPQSVEAYYCAGRCDPGHANRDTLHTHWTDQQLELMQARNVDTPIARCCAPSKLSPLHVVYVDTVGNVLTRTIPNIIVQQCECA